MDFNYIILVYLLKNFNRLKMRKVPKNMFNIFQIHVKLYNECLSFYITYIT